MSMHYCPGAKTPANYMLRLCEKVSSDVGEPPQIKRQNPCYVSQLVTEKKDKKERECK